MHNFAISLRVLSLFILLALIGCQKNDNNDDSRDLILGRNELTLPTNTTGLFLVKQGNGDYKAQSSNEKIAKVSTSSSNKAAIYVMTIASGLDTVTVTDAKGKTASVILTVYSNPIPLVLDQDVEDFEIINGKSRTLVVSKGNGGYVAKSSDESVLKVAMYDDQMLLKGLKEGSSLVTLTDQESQKIEFKVKVSDVVGIRLETTKLTVAANSSKTRSILYGNGTYTVSSTNPQVASAVILGKSRIQVTGLSAGSADIVVSDEKGQKASIDVTVYNAPWAANLGSSWFSVPKLEERTDYKALSNVSYEAFFCMDQAGFLNTIMGLEGTFLLRQNGGKINLYTLDGELVSTTYVKYGEWYYVAATFDGPNRKCALYVNGVKEAELNLRSTTLDLGRTAGVQKPEFEHFMVGMACESRRCLYGSIGEARVWKRTLSELEIIQHCKNISVPNNSAGLIAYWKLNEHTDLLEIPDYSGNGNVGVPSSKITQWSPLAFP